MEHSPSVSLTLRYAVQSLTYKIKCTSLTQNRSNILERIVWHKEKEVAAHYGQRYAASRICSGKSLSAPPARDFLWGVAVRAHRAPALIAEVKEGISQSGCHSRRL
jgi:hypothetical protein